MEASIFPIYFGSNTHAHLGELSKKLIYIPNIPNIWTYLVGDSTQTTKSPCDPVTCDDWVARAEWQECDIFHDSDVSDETRQKLLLVVRYSEPE